MLVGSARRSRRELRKEVARHLATDRRRVAEQLLIDQRVEWLARQQSEGRKVLATRAAEEACQWVSTNADAWIE